MNQKESLVNYFQKLSRGSGLQPEQAEYFWIEQMRLPGRFVSPTPSTPAQFTRGLHGTGV